MPSPKTILIATENPEQLKALCELLSELEVFRASDVEAVEAMANELTQVDMLLCDQTFANADGEAVAAALRGKFPELRVAYMADAAEGRTAQGDQIFGTDTTPESLLEWVRDTTPRPAVQASLIGTTVGDYKILEKRRDLDKAESYLALQISMNRQVVLERLKPAYWTDREEKRRFRNLVRSKAGVVHPSIAAVYEAQELPDGEIFYARELVRGKHLEELLLAGVKHRGGALLHLLQSTGEAMVHYSEHSISREKLQPHHVFLGEDGMPRLANLGLADQAEHPNEMEEIRQMASTIHKLADFKGGAPGLTEILRRMRGELQPIRNWASLVGVVRVARDHLAAEAGPPTDFRERSPSGKSQRKKAGHIWIYAAAAALLVGLFAKMISGDDQKNKSKPKPDAKTLEQAVLIPAGPSIYRKGEQITLPSFSIDRHEVSISQYAEFLKATDGSKAYDHPDQPKEKANHTPTNWDAYYAAAKEGSYEGESLTVDCPVMWVDWWDAYAYAKWKGRRLPTDQEWEKAARGEKGFSYPWGETPDAKKANLGTDRNDTDPAQGGKIDGANAWCGVTTLKDDRSPWGILGMAGNVAEWTSTWDQHPDFPDQQTPVYRGGHFNVKEAPTADHRWTAKSAAYSQPFLGFRTASDK